MDLAKLTDFLFWCMIINFGIYLFTIIAFFAMRGILNRIYKKLFDMDEAEVTKLVIKYLGHYKLLITVFNFTPWISLLIIK